MLTLFLSLAIGAIVGAALHFSNLIHSWVGAILPAILVALAAAILLFRRVAGQIGPVVEEAQRHLQGGRREMALGSLRAGLKWGRWHPLLEAQLRSQIGALLYDSKDYEGAIVELQRAAKTPWESRAFLACAYFKQHEEAPMVQAFEDASKAGEKDDLYWTLYAWCMNAVGKKQEALAVLARGLDKMPQQQRLLGHVEAIKEGKKLKVAPYADRWARFGLDGSIATGGMKIPKAMRGFAQKPGFRQRPVKKR